MRSVFWWNLPSHYSTHIRPPVNPLPSSAHLIIRFVKGNLELYCIVLVFFFPKHVAGHRMIGLTIPYDCTADSWWWWTSRHLSVVESSWSLLLMEDGNKMAVSVMLRMRLKRHLNIESFYQHLKKKKKRWIKTVKRGTIYADWILGEDVLLLQQNTEDWFSIHSHNIYHGVINVVINVGFIMVW